MKVGNSFHTISLFEVLPPVWFLSAFIFHSSEFSGYFYFPFLNPEFIGTISGQVSVIGAWCLLGHTGSDTCHYLYLGMDIAPGSHETCATWGRWK